MMMLFDLHMTAKAACFDLHHGLWSLVVLPLHQIHMRLAWNMSVDQMNHLQHDIRLGKDK